MVHQRLEWFRDRSKKAHRHVCEPHSFRRLPEIENSRLMAALRPPRYARMRHDRE